MGFPKIGTKGFPGNLDEAKRAGIIPQQSGNGFTFMVSYDTFYGVRPFKGYPT
jgi:hypothetical protein